MQKPFNPLGAKLSIALASPRPIPVRKRPNVPPHGERCYFGCGQRARVNSYYCSVECAVRAETERN